MADEVQSELCAKTALDEALTTGMAEDVSEVCAKTPLDEAATTEVAEVVNEVSDEVMTTEMFEDVSGVCAKMTLDEVVTMEMAEVSVPRVVTTEVEEIRSDIASVVKERVVEVRSGEVESLNGNSTAVDCVEEEEVRERKFQSLASPEPGTVPVSCGEEGDEAEIVDEYVVFVGEESNAVSLCVLPLELPGGAMSNGTGSTLDVRLCGESGGLDVMRPLTAWKLTRDYESSFRILVVTGTDSMSMSGAERWLKLGKPRSGYMETAEDVFCVAKFLDFLKKEPHSSEDRVRDHLLEGFFLSATFCDHLRKQRSLMEQYIDSDPALRETDARETLLSLTREIVTNGGKRASLLDDDSAGDYDYPPVKKPKMDPKLETVSMREYKSEGDFYDDDEEMSDEDDDPGDSLCIICDDGGYLLCCDGPCMRSFHPRPKDGESTQCKTLGFPNVTDIEKFKRGWFCSNCKIKRHQCYICGELGDSDEALGSKSRVFVCDVASCGKFYHPKCVASKLTPSGAEREALAKRIWAGEESFTCPLHRCRKCGKGEVKKERDLNLATCRRCPAAWHVKCLPSNLSFMSNEESNVELRAWELGKRFIIYCTDHKILRDLGTPKRNHIKFKEKISEATITSKKPKKTVGTVGNERPDFRAKASSSAAPQVLGKTGDTARPATQIPSEDDARRCVHDIVAKSRREITEESVTAKLFLPSIYQRKVFNWMLHGRFDSILNGARAAMEKIRLNLNNWEDAKLKCAPEQVHAISFEEDRLRTFLAPTLHGKRYTSYGRHFTKIEKLQKVVEVLQPYIWDGDMIVDFSCGDNSFSQLLHNALSRSQKSNCQFKSFDIFTPKNALGFERRDWLSVGVSECGPGDNLVIGLNPPFAHTDRFVIHALSMKPRVLVFIVPPLKIPLSSLGYECLLDDPTSMAEKSFYLPGSVHGLNDDCLEQGNNVAPHLYIFGRVSCFGVSTLNSTFPALGVSNPSSTANPSQQIRESVKRVKRVKPGKSTPLSDPADHLFIPQQRFRGPQHMPEQMSSAPGPGLQIEDGEIQTSSRSSRFHDRPSVRPTGFHGRPHDHHSQLFPLYRNYPAEFRPPHHRDEPYPPFNPGMFPSGVQQRFPHGDPRDFHHNYRGLGPPPFDGFPPASGGWLPLDE